MHAKKIYKDSVFLAKNIIRDYVQRDAFRHLILEGESFI